MDARIISESIPTAVRTGSIWIKPSVMTAYLRLGNNWIPLASGGTDVITFQNITLLINGVDRTDFLESNSLSIDDILTQEVNTCSFNLIDETQNATYKPQIGQEVHIFYRETIYSDPYLIFAGRISEMPQSQFSIKKYIYAITCTDYTQDLQRNLVVESYTNQLAGDIIRNIVATWGKTLGTFYVENGLLINYISFNYQFPDICITQIAELIGYDWYVDYEKQVHFFPPSTNDAPYQLTDNISDGEYRGLEISIDKSSLKNKQIVRGGYQYSDLFSEEQVADGTQLSFNLKYEAFTPISVYVNVGGGYVLHTLGIDNIDESGFDFVVNQTEKIIKNLDHAVLSAGHKIKITYKYKIPIFVQAEDNTSMALMKQYEGGDGIYEGELIVDEAIETKEAARQRALAELVQYSNPLIEGSFTTIQSGYRSGQLLTVNIPSRNINSQYLIRSVTITSIGLGLLEYEITFATKLKGLTDFLIYLFDNGKKVFERTDEILDTLKTFTGDSIIIGGSVPDYSFRNPTTSPYKWSDDAETTIGKGRYGLSSWG